MDRLKIITILISVVALGVAGCASHRATTAEKADVGRRIQAAGSDIAISRNRLGGAGAVELRRGHRLDVFGGLEERIFAPPDFFDLSSIDEDAASKLTATLVVPSTVRPYRRFDVLWEVTGPSSALLRVNSYQLNVFSYGPIFGIEEFAETGLTPDGPKIYGSVATSMWKSGSVKLWARFGSGIKELEVTEVTMDLSNCTEVRRQLFILTSLLRGAAADRFLERVREEAGEDVTVTVLTSADATASSDGFTFHMDIELDGEQGTLTVRLGMQFMIVPMLGNLGAVFSSGGRSVDIDADLPWYDDFWHEITLGEHNLSSYQYRFTAALHELANGFASAIGRQARGLPEEVEDEQEEEDAPKVIATAIDMSSQELIITLCPITGGLIRIGGIFPADAIKLAPY